LAGEQAAGMGLGPGCAHDMEPMGTTKRTADPAESNRKAQCGHAKRAIPIRPVDQDNPGEE
jgi:hypothetical protein